MKGSAVKDRPNYVEIRCGCWWGKDGTPVALCEAHRYITCGKCGTDRAQVTPIGVLCPNCTFK